LIPETVGGPDGAADVLYAVGRHDAIGLSVMGIERSRMPLGDIVGRFDLLTQLAPMILEHQGKGTMSAVLLGPNDPPQKVKVGDYTLEVSHIRARTNIGIQGSSGDTQNAAAIFISNGQNEYYVAGSGVSVTFSPDTPGPPTAGLATVEEGKFVDGQWVPGLKLAGDDAGEGQFVALYRNKDRDTCSFWFNRDKEPAPVTECVERVTLYRYR
jgi:hypothetical protein